MPGIVLSRLWVGLPFVPPSGREIVSRLTGLPIPLFAQSLDAVDECSGSFCMDYYARGLVHLEPADCSKAVSAALDRDWARLPLPEGAEPLQEPGAPAVPAEGYFRFDRRDADETQELAWIDTSTCRVYAELLLW